MLGDRAAKPRRGYSLFETRTPPLDTIEEVAHAQRV
jgi:hypothetical protein